MRDSDGKTLNFDISPVKTEDVAQKESESRFILSLKGRTFLYDTDYSLELKTGIKPKYGNIESKDARTISLSSNKFYDSAESNQRIYSSTGEITGTRMYNPNQDIATKNMFFNLMFEEEVALNNNFFSFQSVK